MTRVHVLVSGQVQGVFFRQETHRRARAAGVAGWVRNLPDGRVEAVFEGLYEAVEQMVDWCGRGPEWADVRQVEVEPEEAEGLEGFEVRRTPSA